MGFGRFWPKIDPQRQCGAAEDHVFFQLDKSRNVGIFFPLPSPFSFNERNSLAIVDELQLTIIRLGDDDIQVTSDGFDMCVVLMIPKTAE